MVASLRHHSSPITCCYCTNGVARSKEKAHGEAEANTIPDQSIIKRSSIAQCPDSCVSNGDLSSNCSPSPVVQKEVRYKLKRDSESPTGMVEGCEEVGKSNEFNEISGDKIKALIQKKKRNRESNIKASDGSIERELQAGIEFAVGCCAKTQRL